MTGAEGQEITAPRAMAPSSAGAARFALVVDDLPLVRNLLKALVASHGFEVITARDGVEAVELAPMFPFSLILTDIEMPRMDGMEAARRIRALGGALAEVPIIAVSGRMVPPSSEECRQSGVDAFYAKGGDTAVLHQALDNAFAGAGR